MGETLILKPASQILNFKKSTDPIPTAPICRYFKFTELFTRLHSQ